MWRGALATSAGMLVVLATSPTLGQSIIHGSKPVPTTTLRAGFVAAGSGETSVQTFGSNDVDELTLFAYNLAIGFPITHEFRLGVSPWLTPGITYENGDGAETDVFTQLDINGFAEYLLPVANDVDLAGSAEGGVTTMFPPEPEEPRPEFSTFVGWNASVALGVAWWFRDDTALRLEGRFQYYDARASTEFNGETLDVKVVGSRAVIQTGLTFR